MAGFTSYADFLSALKNKAFYANFVNANISAGAGQHTSSLQTGPTRGYTFGTALTARTIDNNTFSFGLPFRNPTGSNRTFLSTIGSGNNSGAPFVAILVDRLLEAPFNGTVTSGTFNGGTPLSIPARDEAGNANGNGCYMFLENATASTLTSQSMTVTYTDQAGNTGHSTGSFTVTAEGLGHLPTADLFLPLATGDLGVRAIASYTLGGSIVSTQMNIVICRPLAMWVVDFPAISKDFILGVTQLPRLYSGSCTHFLYTQSGNSGTPSIDLTTVEG